VKLAIDLGDGASARSPDSARKAPAKAEAASSGSHTAVWIGVAATGAFAVGAGVFALLARDAKSDFDHELEKFPTTKERIDDTRSRMKTYAAITDGLGAAAIVSGGVTLLLALSGSSPTASAQQGTTIRVSPRVGGLTVSGAF
jgi:hypothetical protein